MRNAFRLLCLALLGIALLPVVSAQTPRIRATPTMTRNAPARAEMPVVHRVVLSQEAAENNRVPVRTTQPVAPLDESIRLAILIDGAPEAQDGDLPTLTDLTLTVREPYQPEGWLTFLGADVRPGSEWALVKQTGNSVAVSFPAEPDARYLIDFYIDVLYSGGTIRKLGGIVVDQTFPPGPNHFLLVTEGGSSGYASALLSGVDTDFIFDRVVISRLD